jgi:hypothetical protein
LTVLQNPVPVLFWFFDRLGNIIIISHDTRAGTFWVLFKYPLDIVGKEVKIILRAFRFPKCPVGSSVLLKGASRYTLTFIGGS